MSLSDNELAQVLVALAALLLLAHAVGHLFARLRQPRVVGEITAGLLLGPSLLATVAPSTAAAIIRTDGATPKVLGACYQLGLLLLMFHSGAQMRSAFRRSEQRVVGSIALLGTMVPFVAALLLVRVLNVDGLLGEAGSTTALVLVFGLAVAVTSIPVISRIMADLGILGTSFARVVLGIAVLEDTVVYVVLGIALGLASATQSASTGLPSLLGIAPGTALADVYHVLATVVLFGVVLSVGHRVYDTVGRWSRHLLRRSNAVAEQLLVLFALTLLSLLLGVAPMFGAFLAGIVVSRTTGKAEAARATVRDFSFAFFIPIYFAIVGLKIDLIHHFDPVFFAWFLGFACVAKTGSVYLGARLGKESPRSSLNLAIAMNCRGGPGIVLASVTFEAGIISQSFYASLVMLAIVTSLLAGTWLGRAVRLGTPLRDEDALAVVPAQRAPDAGDRRPRRTA